MHVAELWHVEGDRVRCELCPNACLIAAGHAGVCGVRRNHDGELIALTYGRLSSVAADPIEKKPIFHYRPGTQVLSLGSVGCSMRCGHCQNWRISRATPTEGELTNLEPREVARLADEYRCSGVAFTYNEPVIWAEYVRDVARECKDAGLFTVMVTNGYITTAGLDFLGPHIDVWRVDVKGATDATYRSLCRVESVQSVLRGAERARHRWGMHVEVVTNVIPTVNDSDAELRGIAGWIAKDLGADTPWHVTRFFPYLDYAHLPPTPPDTLARARAIGEEEGLSFVYLGNYDEPGAEDTRCPRCGAIALRRSGYTILRQETRDGTCAQCGAALNIIE